MPNLEPDAHGHSTRRLEALLDAAPAPVYAIDGEGRIVYANAALADWLAAPLDAILGSRVEYHSETPHGDGSIGADLCPPPSVLEGTPAVATLALALRDKRLRQRTFRFSPVPQAGVVVAIGAPADLSLKDAHGQAEVAEDASALHQAIRRFRAEQKAANAIDPLLGVSPVAARARRQVDAAIRSQANTLVIGRPGGGQVRVARAIHYATAETSRGLWQFDCRGLPAPELERMLAKAEPGATLLAAQIDRLEPWAQQEFARLLHRLREPVRLLATIDLASPSDESSLSSELAAWFGAEVRLPPLVDRLADLPLLVQLFLEQNNAGSSRQIGSIEPAALDQLALYSWPGDVDQLAGVVAEAHAKATPPEVRALDLPPLIRHASISAASLAERREPLELDALLARVEREAIERALLHAGGNRSEAARLLGLTRARFYRRLRELGIEGNDA